MIQAIVILASENDPRVIGFQQALQQHGLSQARLVNYLDFIDTPEQLANTVNQPFILRIDSPGRDKAVHKKILETGIAPLKSANQAFTDKLCIQQGINDKGRLVAPYQYFLGFSEVMRQLKGQLLASPGIEVMNSPDEILLAFDKYRCQNFLWEHDIAIPTLLGTVLDYESLREMMKQKNIPRVFLKLRHGSAATGIIALEANKQCIQIKTTIESLENNLGEITLYNTRKIQRSTNQSYIKKLVDKLCKMEVYAERWIPKAQVDGYNVDLRILMIAGKAHHKVLRMSHSPMTNLHLLNKRGDVAVLKNKMSKSAWDSLIHSCEKVATLFPQSLYIALDVVVSINLKHHFILEVNAFGDLLKGVTYNKLNPYEAEIAHLKNDHRYTTV